MSLNPKARFGSHKSNVNNYKSGSSYNCGLTEFIIQNMGCCWPSPAVLSYMIIDAVDPQSIPLEVTRENERKIWIFNQLEKLEEQWRTRLNTYQPFGLNKRGESNFRRWVLPKLKGECNAEVDKDVLEIERMGCFVKLNDLMKTEKGRKQIVGKKLVSVKIKRLDVDTGNKIVAKARGKKKNLIGIRRSSRCLKSNRKYSSTDWVL